jgi:hypothetical protein
LVKRVYAGHDIARHSISSARSHTYPLEHFPEKWLPVFRKEMRQIWNPKHVPVTSNRRAGKAACAPFRCCSGAARRARRQALRGQRRIVQCVSSAYACPPFAPRYDSARAEHALARWRDPLFVPAGNRKAPRHGMSRPRVLFSTPRLRKSAKKLTRTAARFAAVGDVTLSCLVGLKVALAP